MVVFPLLVIGFGGLVNPPPPLANSVDAGNVYCPTSHFPEPESDDSWDWEDTRERHSNLDPQQHNEVPIRDVDCNLGAISAISSECATTSGHSKHQLDDDEIQAGVRPFGCSVCGKRYRWKNSLNDHMELHAAEIPFSCSLCGKRYRWKRSLSDHMELHAAEKPFSCSLFCGKRFGWKKSLASHLSLHSEERLLKNTNPFKCSLLRLIIQ
uniref:C2H2-type domain-containing protein n=1 Tax=Sparus aurata TaxID=8175 RepID=A0A671WWC9_SPAAU